MAGSHQCSEWLCRHKMSYSKKYSLRDGRMWLQSLSELDEAGVIKWGRLYRHGVATYSSCNVLPLTNVNFYRRQPWCHEHDTYPHRYALYWKLLREVSVLRQRDVYKGDHKSIDVRGAEAVRSRRRPHLTWLSALRYGCSSKIRAPTGGAFLASHDT